MNKVGESYSHWNPEFSPEAIEHIAKLRASVEPKIQLMQQFRKGLGLTQTQVAEILGMTQANVSKIEKRGDPSLSVLARMAEAKGMRLSLALKTKDGDIEKSFAVG